MFNTQQDYLTVSEAAQLLRVSPDAVRRWAREGHIKSSKVGIQGRYRIRVEDLQEVIRDGRRT